MAAQKHAAQALSLDCRRIFKDSASADVIVRSNLDGAEFHCHLVVLASRSEYFARRLHEQAKPSEYVFSDVGHDELHTVLWFIYSGVLRREPLENARVARGVLSLASASRINLPFVEKYLRRRFLPRASTGRVTGYNIGNVSTADTGSICTTARCADDKFCLSRHHGCDIVLTLDGSAADVNANDGESTNGGDKCGTVDAGSAPTTQYFCAASVLLCARSEFFAAALAEGRWAHTAPLQHGSPGPQPGKEHERTQAKDQAPERQQRLRQQWQKSDAHSMPGHPPDLPLRMELGTAFAALTNSPAMRMEQTLHFIYTDELMLRTCADQDTGQDIGQDTGQDTGTSVGAGAGSGAGEPDTLSIQEEVGCVLELLHIAHYFGITAMAEALQECSVLADLLDNCASPNRVPGAGRGDGNAKGFSDAGDGDDSGAAGWNTLCDLWTMASAHGWCILSERIAEIFERKFVLAARSGALARLGTTQLHRVLLHGRVAAPPTFVLEQLRDWARARLRRGHCVGDHIFGARGKEQGLRGLLDQADVARCAGVSRSVSLAVRSCGVGRGAYTANTASDQVAQTGHTEQAVEAVLAPLMPPRTMLCAEWRGWLLGNRSAAGAAGIG